MAAPTDVRVFATSISTATVKWTYAGSNTVSVWRSTDGAAYSSVGLVNAGTTSFDDTGLSTGTKYWYKLSDDGGSTFSSVVTVITQVCPRNPDGSDTLTLPRFGDLNEPQPQAIDESNPGAGVTLINNELVEQRARLDDMAQRVEEVLGSRVLEPQQCAICPVDGALVIDCSSGCHDWVVVVDQDINSISMNWCDDGDGNVEFVVPPNTTRRICGWPSGFGFTGDECFQAPISGGTEGRSVNVGTGRSSGNRGNPSGTRSRPGYGGGSGSGGGSGGGCNCVPNGNGALTIKSCNTNNSLKCTSTKSLKLIACGGKGPYTWSKTGTIQLSATSGTTTTVTPPTNSGSGTAGDAYQVCHWTQQRTPDCAAARTTFFKDRLLYGCNDQLNTTSGVNSGCPASPSASLMLCVESLGTCDLPQCAASGHGDHYASDSQDIRTGPMIAAGCVPCGVAVAGGGATVTVTDAVGTQTTIIVRN